MEKNIEISPEIENRTDCDEEFSRMLSAIAKGTKTWEGKIVEYSLREYGKNTIMLFSC